MYVVFVFFVHFSLFRPIHHDITTSFFRINTRFLYLYSNRFSVAIDKHKGEYYCNIYFKIAVVNIVSCIDVPYLFHYFIFITRLSSASESLHCFNTHFHIHEKIVLIAETTLLHCLIFTVCFIVPINEHKGKIYSTTVPSHRMLSSYSLYTCLFFDRYTMT